MAELRDIGTLVGSVDGTEVFCGYDSNGLAYERWSISTLETYWTFGQTKVGLVPAVGATPDGSRVLTDTGWVVYDTAPTLATSFLSLTEPIPATWASLTGVSFTAPSDGVYTIKSRVTMRATKVGNAAEMRGEVRIAVDGVGNNSTIGLIAINTGSIASQSYAESYPGIALTAGQVVTIEGQATLGDANGEWLGLDDGVSSGLEVVRA